VAFTIWLVEHCELDDYVEVFNERLKSRCGLVTATQEERTRTRASRTQTFIILAACFREMGGASLLKVPIRPPGA
jgi:hypothetical protein